MNSLTARQNTIAKLAAPGLSNGQIAEQLGLTVPVLRAELSEIYRQWRIDLPGASADTDAHVLRQEDRP